MKNIITLFKNTIVLLTLLVCLSYVTADVAYAQPAAWTEDYCVIDNVATIQGLECLIGNVFTVIITLIGFSGFIMFIVASFRWLLSGGNTKGIETARNTMTFAIVGIVLSLSAFIILNLVSEFTGVKEILEFNIPSS